MAVEWSEYRRSFIANAQGAGLDQTAIERGLAYAERLANAGLPIIVDENHVAEVLGFESTALEAALEVRDKLYRTSYVPKRAGGYRRIDAPIPSLKAAQTWILRNVIDHVPAHDAATAFRANTSIRTNAALHVEKTLVLSLDVTDFFPSLRAERVHDAFMGLGYSDRAASRFVALTTLKGGLPQGAPTSPGLSNLLMRGFDESMSAAAAAVGCAYSRYADDITFSGHFPVGGMINVTRQLLAAEDLELNEAKTRLMRPHQRQEVTGVVVNVRTSAPRELRRYLRHHVHMLKKFGVPEEVPNEPERIEQYKRHLRGVAEFVLFLDANDRDAREAVTLLGRVVF